MSGGNGSGAKVPARRKIHEKSVQQVLLHSVVRQGLSRPQVHVGNQAHPVRYHFGDVGRCRKEG